MGREKKNINLAPTVRVMVDCFVQLDSLGHVGTLPWDSIKPVDFHALK